MTSITNNSCGICCEDFNKSSRAKVNCPQCEYPVCRGCTRTYLLGSNDEAHCLNCKNRWELDTVTNATLKSFINKEYKEHRKSMLFEREQSRLPDTMGAVENYKKVESMVCEHLQLRDKITEMRDAYNELKTKDAQLQSDIRRYRSGEVKDKKKFTKGCPKEDCRGFLSTQWKCGLCKTNVCSKCLIIKELDGAGKIIEHECCQDDVKSAELIKKETRSCPSCATSIYKIEGCFAKGTSVLLWNGKTKMVEDIETGDKLVGTDGAVRIVKDTVSGEDQLYTVHQTNGTPYTVNSKHTLLLKPTYFKKILIRPTYIKVLWFNRTTTSFKSKKLYYTTDDYNDKLLEVDALIENIDESPVRIIIDDYLKLNNSVKKRLYGFKSQNICWKPQPVELDPYILGSWLGDGYSDGSGISGNDTEVIQKWMEWTSDNDGEIVHSNPYRFSVRRKGAGYKRGAVGSETDCPVCVKTKFSLCETTVDYKGTVKPRNSTCPLKDALKKYNLLHNKHIPESYLMNERSIRLKLLAGIVDTDGCLTNHGKRITVVQVNKLLSDQICTLARSLGFVVNMRIIKKLNVKVPNCDKLKDYKDQCSINISGEHLSEIPTAISRKKCMDSNSNKDHFKTSINVSFKEFGTYYGFMVDKDNEFILPDFTSVKNCDQMWCTQCHTAFSWKSGLKVNGVVHNPHFYQWQNAGANAAPVNVPGAVMCGGLPDWFNYRREICSLLKVKHGGKSHHGLGSDLYRKLFGCYRAALHFANWELDNVRRICNITMDNTELRVQYIINELTADEFKSQIMKRDKKLAKNKALLQIYELVNTVFIETIRDVYESSSELKNLELDEIIITVGQKMQRLDALRIYANNELAKISVLYSQNVSIIQKDYFTDTCKFSKNNIESLLNNYK